MIKHLKSKQFYIIPIIIILLFLIPKNVVYCASQKTTESEMNASNVSKFILLPLGDFLNRAINSMSGELTENQASVTLYTTDEIKQSYKFRSQIDVKDESNNTETEEKDEPGTVYIDSIIYNKYGDEEEIFTSDTKIPVLPLDVYTLLAGKAQVTDINFWKLEETNNNKYWEYIKNIVTMIAHIVLYLSVGAIFTMIIWRSVLIVYNTMTSQPKKASDSKKVIDNLFISILIMIGIYILMAGCAILHDKALQFIFKNKQSVYPIRVVVSGVYSFNSSLAGILRYQSLTTNTWHQLGWSIAYLIFSFFNIIFYFLMIARMLVLGLLSALAPLTAVMKMSGLSEGNGFLHLFHFKNWIKHYLRFTFVPVAIAFATNIMINLFG